MRRIALSLLLGATALAGCSSGNNTVYERLRPALQQQLGGLLGGEPEPAAPAAGEAAAAAPATGELTRAQVREIPFAVITVRVGDSPRGFVVPVTDNSGYVVYQDLARRSVVLHGGLINATHGFGYDLNSVANRRDDPIVVRTPVAQWPTTLERNYSFSIRGQQSYDIAVACAFHRGVREFIEIVELRFEVVRMVETCRNPTRSFVNTYWVAPESGFVWKSEQWVGPNQAPFTIEIVKPYAAG